MRLFRIVCASFVMFLSSALLFAQIPTKPAFEVASIKVSPPLSSLTDQIKSGTVRHGMTVRGARFDCHMELLSLIAAAYRIKTSQILGPDWLSSRRFEIHATISEGTSKDLVPEMLQTLLEERFKLKAHLGNKEQPVYALVVSKEGPKLMNADDTSSTSDADATPFGTSAPGNGTENNVVSINTLDGQRIIKQEGDSIVSIDPRTGPVRMSSGSNGTVRIDILKMSMSAFAEWLTPLIDRPVVDATDLKGSYKMTMELPTEVIRNAFIMKASTSDLASSGANPFRGPATSAPGTDGPVGNASDPSGRAVFSAVEKLGLKLDRRKALVETLIIEQVEKNPTEN